MKKKSTKRKAVHTANKYAIEIPLEAAELSLSVLEIAVELVKKGNPNSVSDVGVAGEVALAGVRGACMNVLINLPAIKDKRYTNRKKKQVDELIVKAQKLEQGVFRQTLKVIEE